MVEHFAKRYLLRMLWLRSPSLTTALCGTTQGTIAELSIPLKDAEFWRLRQVRISCRAAGIAIVSGEIGSESRHAER